MNSLLMPSGRTMLGSPVELSKANEGKLEPNRVE
jgi:hypothetical protein